MMSTFALKNTFLLEYDSECDIRFYRLVLTTAAYKLSIVVYAVRSCGSFDRSHLHSECGQEMFGLAVCMGLHDCSAITRDMRCVPNL